MLFHSFFFILPSFPQISFIFKLSCPCSDSANQDQVIASFRQAVPARWPRLGSGGAQCACIFDQAIPVPWIFPRPTFIRFCLPPLASGRSCVSTTPTTDEITPFPQPFGVRFIASVRNAQFAFVGVDRFNRKRSVAGGHPSRVHEVRAKSVAQLAEKRGEGMRANPEMVLLTAGLAAGVCFPRAGTTQQQRGADHRATRARPVRCHQAFDVRIHPSRSVQSTSAGNE